MPVLHRLEIVTPEDDFALAEALVARHISYGWEEESLPTGETMLRVHCPELALLDALMADLHAFLPSVAFSRSMVEDQDWVAAWRDFFTPVHAGKFLVLPPWLMDTPAGEYIPIIIEPKSAFGTGHHPTTTLCLDAISRLHTTGNLVAGQRFLDLGTGTGILGIGCVKLGLTGLGLDIDCLAVSNALENRALNKIDSELTVQLGSVDQLPGQQYDLVIANILAAPLIEMAEQIMGAVKPGGCLILSGFLGVQTPGLEAAYTAMGAGQRLAEASIVVKPEGEGKPEEWVCLMWSA